MTSASLRVLWLLVLLVVAASSVIAGSSDVICLPTCDGGTACQVVTLPDPAGLQRFGMAHRVTTAGDGIQAEASFVEIDGARIDLDPDTLVSLFYQTHPTYRAELAPGETWIGFSAPRLVSVDGFIRLGWGFTHLATSDPALNDTRIVQISLLPPAYSDTPSLADSVAATAFRAQFSGAVARPTVLSNLFMAQEDGRYLSNAGGETVYLPKAGDLVITEIMKDPSGSLSDDCGEWFEVTNVAPVKINLEGVVVRDDGSDYFQSHAARTGGTAPVVLAPGGIAVFGKKRDTRLNGRARVDIEFEGAVTLANASDAIVLEVPGIGVIDRVDYGASAPWPSPSGKSIELADTAADNNVGSNWTIAAQIYGSDTQYGTPGAPYNTAAESPAVGASAVAPEAGDLVITEISSQPRGDDAVGEWFEVFNRRDTPVLLANLAVEMTDESGASQSFQVTTPAILDAKSYFVFARSRAAGRGGMPFGYDYPDNVSIHNDRGMIAIRNETGTTIDSVSYDGDLFPGFPDYGNDTNGGWPMPSEYDGRTLSLKGSLADLLSASYDNNDPANWSLASYWKLNLFGDGLIGTPGSPNREDLALALSMPASINAGSHTETFAVTITPPAGFAPSDVDTASLRLFWQGIPTRTAVGPSTIVAEFRSDQVPSHIERNIPRTAYVTANYLGDSPQRFGGAAPFEMQDTALPNLDTTSTPAPGDLLITEIMVNPNGDEDAREYFEIYNTTSDKTFDLRDMGVMDGGGTTSDSTPEAKSRVYNRTNYRAARLGPLEHAVIGRNHHRRRLGGYESDGTFLHQDLSFANTGDQVVLFRLSDGVVLAEVDYAAAGFPSQASTTTDGRSLSLVALDRDPAQGANWVNASIPFGDTGYGTPGEPNRIAAAAGDVALSEVYPDPPPGGEPNAEFFEIANPDTRYAIDLAGLIVEGDSNDTFAVDDPPGKVVSGGTQRSHIPPGGVIVFGYSRGTSDGVDATFDDTFGLNVTGYDYPAWTLKNASDAVRLIRFFSGGDTATIHNMSYVSSTAGKSWALSTLSDTSIYTLQTPSPTQAPPQQ